GQAYLDDEPVGADALAQRLRQIAAEAPDTEVQLRADTAVPYGRVVEVMGAAHAAGLQRIGFVTQPTDGAVQGTQK
ncbi:biopolymer transporter ExbD, partial [Diaphorobacter sp. DS2]